MRFLLFLLFLLCAVSDAGAQTNIFPSTGSMGVGITSPSSTYGATIRWNNYNLRLDTSSSANSEIYFATEDANKMRIGLLGATNKFRIRDEVNSADRLVIGSDGNVGIGTDSPTTRLQSDGIVSIRQGPANYLIDNTATLRLGRYNNGSGISYGYLHAPYGESIHLWNHATYTIAEFKDNRDALFFGNVGIGTTSPSHKLAVNGTVRAKEVVVDTGWSDYVFADDYRLAPLSEVEAHIREKRHLPGIPSAAQVAEQGISLGEMQAKLLEKIEELTLHQIALAKEVEGLRRENSELRQAMKAFSTPTK